MHCKEQTEMPQFEFIQVLGLPSQTSETYKEWSEYAGPRFVFLYKEETPLDSGFILTFC